MQPFIYGEAGLLFFLRLTLRNQMFVLYIGSGNDRPVDGRDQAWQILRTHQG